MPTTVKQLKDKGTGTPFVPVTAWEAVTNKPQLVPFYNEKIILKDQTTGHDFSIEINNGQIVLTDLDE